MVSAWTGGIGNMFVNVGTFHRGGSYQILMMRLNRMLMQSGIGFGHIFGLGTYIADDSNLLHQS